MVQIVQERRRPSFAERLNTGVGAGLQGVNQLVNQYQQQQLQNQQKQAIAQQFGEEVANLPPELQKEYIAQQLQGQRAEDLATKQFGHQAELQRQKYEFEQQGKAKELEGKKEEAIAPLQNALSDVKKMRQIRKRGNLGFFSPITGAAGGQTAKDRGEYTTIGNSLIQYASSIPIRNKVEFEKLAGRISDPNITDAEAEGILDAMERIIQNNLNVKSGGSNLPSHLNKPEKPSLSNFVVG